MICLLGLASGCQKTVKVIKPDLNYDSRLDIPCDNIYDCPALPSCHKELEQALETRSSQDIFNFAVCEEDERLNYVFMRYKALKESVESYNQVAYQVAPPPKHIPISEIEHLIPSDIWSVLASKVPGILMFFIAIVFFIREFRNATKDFAAEVKIMHGSLIEIIKENHLRMAVIDKATEQLAKTQVEMAQMQILFEKERARQKGYEEAMRDKMQSDISLVKGM